jgi:hypothetical protein
MAKRNGFHIDYQVFSDFAEELEKLGADLKEVFTDVMEQEGENVAQDTKEAVQKAYLPAKGAYSTGDTEKTIVMQPKVHWSGSVGEINLGFDKHLPGAGGFLITGTPKMQPDHALEDIYVRKRYQRNMTKSMMDSLQDQIDVRIGRFK